MQECKGENEAKDFCRLRSKPYILPHLARRCVLSNCNDVSALLSRLKIPLKNFSYVGVYHDSIIP